jgi:hypothetical protein
MHARRRDRPRRGCDKARRYVLPQEAISSMRKLSFFFSKKYPRPSIPFFAFSFLPKLVFLLDILFFLIFAFF